MSKEKKKYDPADKYNWGAGDFSVILEPHETKGLTDKEIVQLMNERKKALEDSKSDTEE